MYKFAKKEEIINGSKNEFLGTESIGKLMFKLTLPAIAAQIINMLYNIVDRIYIGHMPEVGALALTGLGVTYPLLLPYLHFLL